MVNRCLLIFIFIWGLLIGMDTASAAELSVTIKNVSDDSDVLNGEINWSGIEPGITEWKAADQYLFIEYSLAEGGGLWGNDWGLQIFTDNTSVSRNTKYVYTVQYAVPEGMPDDLKENIEGKIAGDFAAGLIHEEGKHRLPMCWRVTFPKPFENKETDLSIVETEGHSLRRMLNENYNCWIWMKDRANDGWSDPFQFWGQWFPNPELEWEEGMDYATAVCPQGIQHAEMSFDGWGVGPVDGQNNGLYGIYVYLGADFSEVAGGDYKTKIYVQLYHY